MNLARQNAIKDHLADNGITGLEFADDTPESKSTRRQIVFTDGYSTGITGVSVVEETATVKADCPKGDALAMEGWLTSLKTALCNPTGIVYNGGRMTFVQIGPVLSQTTGGRFEAVVELRCAYVRSADEL